MISLGFAYFYLSAINPFREIWESHSLIDFEIDITTSCRNCPNFIFGQSSSFVVPPLHFSKVWYRENYASRFQITASDDIRLISINMCLTDHLLCQSVIGFSDSSQQKPLNCSGKQRFPKYSCRYVAEIKTREKRKT